MTHNRYFYHVAPLSSDANALNSAIESVGFDLVNSVSSPPITQAITDEIKDRAKQWAATKGIKIDFDNATVQLTDFPGVVSSFEDPILAFSTMMIMSSNLFGTSTAIRLNNVKHMLAIISRESNYDPNALNSSTSASGLFQFLEPAYTAAVTYGKAIIKQDALLSIIYRAFGNFMVSQYGVASVHRGPWPTDKTDLDQLAAVLGQLWFLNLRIAEDWTWTADGYRTKKTFKEGSNARMLMKDYAAVLSNREMGRQLLMTFYNVYPYGLALTSFPYPTALVKDVVYYGKMSKIDRFGKFIKFIAPMSFKLKEIISKVSDLVQLGDVAAGYTKLSIAHATTDIHALNSLIADSITPPINDKFSIVAAGTGKITITKAGKQNKWQGPTHPGIDLQAAYQQPVFSLIDGYVTDASFYPSSGNYLKVSVNSDDYDGVVVMHLSKMIASKGDHVVKGQLIGLAGSTGTKSTGTHVHLGVIDNHKWIDPEISFIKDNIKEVTNAPGT